MNNKLPTSFKKSSFQVGFTLIELLVVIAIIAILAVMGFAAFSGLTSRGNDGRRQTDIKAISNVYEVKKTSSMSNYGTLALTVNDFSAGSIPVDPITAKGSYCIATSTTTPINNAAISATDGIDATGCHGGTWAAVSTTALPANTTYFKICAANQTNTATFCAGNRQ